MFLFVKFICNIGRACFFVVPNISISTELCMVNKVVFLICV